VLAERGRTLEPVIAAMARWYLRDGLDELQVDANRFSATSARSVLESLPFLLREERAAGVDLTFEIRLTGLGGGVWTVHIHGGACTVREGFAERADVRYTADARVWCGVALGISDAKAVHRRPDEQGRRPRGPRLLLSPDRARAERPRVCQAFSARAPSSGRRGQSGRSPTMISFAMTDEQEAARDTMRGFAESALRPRARDCDEAAAIPTRSMPRRGTSA
jgi:hypothetical protein